MKFEERKLISIPRAIGLFMLFEGLFRRDALSGIIFNDSSTYHLLLKISAASSIYLLMITGILLCVTRSLLIFYLAYLTCIISLFGIVYEILPGSESTLLWQISLGVSHLLVMAILIWTHRQISKCLLEKT